ncbi:SRPBCC family protein [Arthrobacter celericrescens]|uniref:SRPBCC family protein n=1 Tax=Arthrobacter celericrescens TaxID=2320851 RepID=UPI0013C4B59B|nr:SRPBCC family protein [Arthrobacter celericrescens]
MLCIEVADVVVAAPGTVMDVLADASNFEVWDSGTTHHSGDVRNGSRIVLGNGHHHCAFDVQLARDTRMTWTHTGFLGLFRATRTYILTPGTGGTRVQVVETFTGPLARTMRARGPLAGSTAALNQHLQAAKSRAELLERTGISRRTPDASAA